MLMYEHALSLGKPTLLKLLIYYNSMREVNSHIWMLRESLPELNLRPTIICSITYNNLHEGISIKPHETIGTKNNWLCYIKQIVTIQHRWQQCWFVLSHTCICKYLLLGRVRRNKDLIPSLSTEDARNMKNMKWIRGKRLVTGIG